MKKEEIKTVNEKETIEESPVNQTVPKEPKKKKRRIGSIIINVILTIIVLVVLIEAAIGVVNMKKINNGEKPVWYLSTKVTEYKNKTVTEYNLGLYRIEKTDTEKDSKTVLKPFFIKD